MKLSEFYKKKYPTDKDYQDAAEVLFGIIYTHERTNGKILTNEPKFVCHLKNPIPLPVHRTKEEKDKNFNYFINKAFKKETDKDWNSSKYVLIHVPHDLLGSSRYVVFEK